MNFWVAEVVRLQSSPRKLNSHEFSYQLLHSLSASRFTTRSVVPHCGFAAQNSLGKQSTLDRESLTAHFDNVVRKKLSASASFQHAVHFDFTVLDHELGMSPGSRNGTQFQELIQTEFSRFGIGVRHSRALL